MQLRILGCSGGIGGNLRTTSMLLDHDVLIDAGTGVGDLTLTELKQIDHIFVTHSHLDHIACIPFLVDTVGGMRDGAYDRTCDARDLGHPQSPPLQLEDLAGFRGDSQREAPYLRYERFRVGSHQPAAGARSRAVPANHVVPAVGFHLDSGEGSLVFTGDTTTNDALWEVVNRIENLRYLIIETAFSECGAGSRHRLQAPDAGHAGAGAGQAHAAGAYFRLSSEAGRGCADDGGGGGGRGRLLPRMLSNGQVFKF